MAGGLARRAGDAARDAARRGRPPSTGPTGSRSSSAATRCAATSSTTRSACSRRRCGGSARSSCGPPTRRACRPAPRWPSTASAFSAVVTRAIARASAHHGRARGGDRDPGVARTRRTRSIIATGPLTSDALSAAIAAFVGQDHLYFYDAISPIVAGRVDRSSEGVPRVALGSEPGPAGARPSVTPGGGSRRGPACGVDDGRRRLSELPDDAAEYRRVLRRADARRDGHRPRLRQGAVLRGLPADRGAGASRRRHAAVRADEAGRPRRPAHRAPAVRRRAAAPGHARRRSLQPRRVPDAAEVGRAGARAADDPGPRAGRVRALRHGAPQHVHQRPDGAARRRGRRGRAPDLFFAGQISGVEGYVESAASGLLAGINAAALAAGEAPAAAAAHDGDRRAGLLCVARVGRRTTSRPTSPSASWSRSSRRRGTSCDRKTRALGARAGGSCAAGWPPSVSACTR